MKHLFLCLLALVFSFNLFSQNTKEINKEEITELLYQYTDDESPGIAVGIIQEGSIVYEQYIGYSNLDHKINFDQNTRSNIASTAKQFTALMILELSQQNKLSLEDDIRKYLPSLYANVKEEIKIRQLINHTSGIRDYVFIFEIMNKPAWRQMGMDNGDIIELLERQKELVFKPGTQYSYSNSGYTILTAIIEKVTGERFNDYSNNFFKKLGMNETFFVNRYMGTIPNRADAYSDWGEGEWLSTPMVTKFNGDGYLYTTLKDQLIYEKAIQNAYRDQDTLLIESQKPIPSSNIKSYGFGLELDKRLGKVAQAHSGSTFGYHSHISRFPEEKLSIFVMSNNNSIWSGTIADEIAKSIFGISDVDINYDPRMSVEPQQKELPPIMGQYLSPNGSLVRIERKDDKTIWKFANYNPLELTPESKNRYAFGYNSKIKLRFYEDKFIRFYPTGKTDVFLKQDIPSATFDDIEGLLGKYTSKALGMSFEISKDQQNEIKIKFSNDEDIYPVEALNRNELLASNYMMKIERDQYERPTDILVTLNSRARNNRFKKHTNLIYQPKIATNHGSIQVSTIQSQNGETSDILVTTNDSIGNEIWSKRLGGSSYDKASSIMALNDGYLVIGSTSSYGNGNYDIYVIKIDQFGNMIWQNTFGDFYNEYGYSAERTPEGYLIKGTKQQCSSNSDVLNRECNTSVWFINIDFEGNEISRELLEEIK